MADIRVQGRATQGVRIINLEKRNDTIASVCCVDSDPEEEVEEVEVQEVVSEIPADGVLAFDDMDDEEIIEDDEIDEEEPDVNDDEA